MPANGPVERFSLVQEDERFQAFRNTTDDLRNSAATFADGQTSTEQFVSELLSLDSQRLKQAGVTLCVSDTSDGWLSVMLKHTATGKLWAAFEVLPGGKRLRRFGNLPAYHPALRPELKDRTVNFWR